MSRVTKYTEQKMKTIMAPDVSDDQLSPIKPMSTKADYMFLVT